MGVGQAAWFKAVIESDEIKQPDVINVLLHAKLTLTAAFEKLLEYNGRCDREVKTKSDIFAGMQNRIGARYWSMMLLLER